MWKIGDKLLCVNNSKDSYINNTVIIGKIYTVTKVEINSYDFIYYSIDDIDGVHFEEDSDYYNFFKLDVKTIRKQKIQKLYE